MTIILVEHETEEIARCADRVILMDEGRIVVDKNPREFFRDVDELKKMGVDPPQVSEFTSLLIRHGILTGDPAITVEEGYQMALTALAKRHPKR